MDKDTPTARRVRLKSERGHLKLVGQKREHVRTELVLLAMGTIVIRANGVRGMLKQPMCVKVPVKRLIYCEGVQLSQQNFLDDGVDPSA